MKTWIVYYWESKTGKFHQQQAHTEILARAIGESILKSGVASETHIEYAEPYSIAK